MSIRTVVICILLALLAGSIFLQIFLCGRENKWLGLILPVISFIYSLLAVLGLATYDFKFSGDTFLMITTTFFIMNVPTVVLAGICLGCRKWKKDNSA